MQTPVLLSEMMCNRTWAGWAAQGGGPCAASKTQTTLFLLCFCLFVVNSVRILRVVT